MLIPEVKNVMSWKEALAFAKGLDVVLIPYELAQGMKETREILAAIQPGQSVGIFIGPEGGFEEEEERCHGSRRETGDPGKKNPAHRDSRYDHAVYSDVYA